MKIGSTFCMQKIQYDIQNCICKVYKLFQQNLIKVIKIRSHQSMSDSHPAQKKMPASLMEKFMEGVEDDPNEPNDWATAIEQRPQRLGLGANPKQKSQSSMTNAERRVKNMVSKQSQEDSSSDSEEMSRSKIGNRK